MSCFWRNRDTTSGPNVKETPLSFSDQPVMSLSGSDQSRSHSNPDILVLLSWREEGVPVSGTSVGRMTRLICSMEERSGDKPPCMVKIFSSMMAAIGRQLKQSVKVFHNLMLYLRLPNHQHAVL